mmetsp:Transcript_90909/g.161822  ORF Transcript_90909/g.161822 Transcript_90909/m.161822 type:complete len:332 (-) Transcript_90909:112-1107(-)
MPAQWSGAACHGHEELPRQPCAFYNIPGEAALVGKICEILSCNPMEVNNLSSKFAAVFNKVVRNHEKTPFVPDQRNDGSFKKWLLSCGFEVGPLFERNRALVYLPRLSTAQGECGPPPQEIVDMAVQKGRQRNRKGSGRGSGCKNRWEARPTQPKVECDTSWIAQAAQAMASAAQACNVAEEVPIQIPMEAAHACNVAEEAVDTGSPNYCQGPEALECQSQSVEPEPEQSTSQAAPSDDEDQQSEESTADVEPSRQVSQDESAAWVEVHPSFLQVDDGEDEDDFVLVGRDGDTWEASNELPAGRGGFQISDDGCEGLSARWLVEDPGADKA